jgi:hypothetical protein
MLEAFVPSMLGGGLGRCCCNGKTKTRKQEQEKFKKKKKTRNNEENTCVAKGTRTRNFETLRVEVNYQFLDTMGKKTDRM